MVKVTEFPLVIFLSVNDPETCFRVNDPPVCCVEMEQIMPNVWPQVTSPVGADIWGLTRETANKQDNLIQKWLTPYNFVVNEYTKYVA